MEMEKQSETEKEDLHIAKKQKTENQQDDAKASGSEPRKLKKMEEHWKFNEIDVKYASKISWDLPETGNEGRYWRVPTSGLINGGWY